MYPTVIVKSLSGFLVVLLIFSEVHSFIFEDEGGTEFCLRTDDINQNKSTQIWLEKSYESGQKIELNDCLTSLRNNGKPRKDFRQIPVLLREGRILKNRQNTESRESRSSDQAGRQRDERFSTNLSRVSYDTPEKSRKIKNGAVTEIKGISGRSRRTDIRATRTTETGSAKLSENRSTQPRNIRYARSFNNRSARSDGTRPIRSDIVRSRSIDSPASRSTENQSTRSRAARNPNQDVIKVMSFENLFTELSPQNRDTRLDVRRAMRMSDNRPIRSANSGSVRSKLTDTRYIRADSIDATRSRNNRGTKFNGSSATRSVETRGLNEIDSTRSDNIGTSRSLDSRAARSNEIRSTRLYEIRSRSTNNSASRLKDKRLSRSTLTQYSRSDSKGDIIYLENRVSESDENRAERSVDRHAMRLSGNPSKKSYDIRTTRSFDNRVVRSDEIRSTRSHDIRSRSMDDLVSRSNENQLDRSVLPRNIRSYSNGAIRSVDLPMVSEEKRNRAALKEKTNGNSRVRIFSIETGRNLPNNRDQTLINRQFADSNTRRSSLFEENYSRENPRIVRDFRSQRDYFINTRSERSFTHRDEKRIESSRINGRRSERFIENTIRRKSSPKFENQGSSTGISILSSRYHTIEHISQESVQEAGIIRGMTRGDAGRRGSSLSLPNEGDSRRLFQEGRQTQYGTENSRNTEINTRSLDIRGLLQESRRKPSFVSADGNQFQRIREFGNDKRQRQNSRMRARENSNEIGARDDLRRVLVLTNLRNTYEEISSVASIRRTAERLLLDGNDRKQQENSRVDTRRVKRNTAGRDSVLTTLHILRQRVRGERMRPKWEDRVTASNNARNLRRVHEERKSRNISRERTSFAVDDLVSYRKYERVSFDDRVMLRRATKDFGSVNSRRESFVRYGAVSGLSDSELRDTPTISARKTRRYRNGIMRISNNMDRKHEVDGAMHIYRGHIRVGLKVLEQSKMDDRRNVVKTEPLIRNNGIVNLNDRFVTERVVLWNSRRGNGYFNTDTWDSAASRWRKMDAQGDISLKKVAVGISSYGVLQLTLATILVAQLINFTGGHSKGGYFNNNWIRKIKSF